jgi:hypothetical protein
MPQKYRVVNLTGEAFERQKITVQAGVNFFDHLSLGFLAMITRRERFLVEEFCPIKQNYVEFGNAAIVETDAHEPNPEPEPPEEEQVPVAPDDPQTPTQVQTEATNSGPPVTESPEFSNISLDPELENILKLTNDQANDVIVDLNDKALLQRIIDAPTVKSGTRSAAIRRLNHINAH